MTSTRVGTARILAQRFACIYRRLRIFILRRGRQVKMERSVDYFVKLR